MKKTGIIFPHQLFERNPVAEVCEHLILVEEFLFFRQYRFHKQKLAFHRATMKYYEAFLQKKNHKITYASSDQPTSDIRKLLSHLRKKGLKIIHITEVDDDWLERRIKESCRENDLNLEVHESPMFLNTKKMLKPFFEGKKTFRQTSFYIEQRKRWDIMIGEDGKPEGGKWTFDEENRLKYPKNKTAPAIKWPSDNTFTTEAMQYVQDNFSDHYGHLGDFNLYPVTHQDALNWFEDFLNQRFFEFGKFQDSMVRNETLLHHSLLSPLLNSGLLTPGEIIDKTILFTSENKVPLNSLEGFIRQIIGWREFLRGVYIFRGRRQRSTNFWGFERKISRKFYHAETGILPVDDVIQKVMKTGYAHHIERLMIIGNFMLLCEINPDETYQWFMELFIDAYDWVMVPNVYGMSQFADGGLLATKPYISGSNYIMKMSNYPKGGWQETWDGLFWRFLDKHRLFFRKNPRLNMLVKSFDKMDAEKQKKHLKKAEVFLASLD